MNNIFEGAYFGKPYITRDGRKAIYLGNDGTSEFQHKLNIEGRDAVTWFNDFGMFCGNFEDRPDDIVSEWIEEINEDELKELAWHYIETTDMPCRYEETAFYAFISGYKKAKKE